MPVDRREKNPHIVERFTIGNTRIAIADNYCLDREKDKAEIDAILDRVAQIALNAWAGERIRQKRKRENA